MYTKLFTVIFVLRKEVTDSYHYSYFTLIVCVLLATYY